MTGQPGAADPQCLTPMHHPLTVCPTCHPHEYAQAAATRAGAALGQLRHALGVTPDRLCQVTGISTQRLGAIETGADDPTRLLLTAMLAALASLGDWPRSPHGPYPDAAGGDHATVHGQVLRDQTAGDLGIAGGPPDAYRSGPEQHDDAPEPGYQRIADAIRDALDGADLQIVVWQAGQNTPVTDGVARLARTLDKAGLIDWREFT